LHRKIAQFKKKT
jgi:hypothetical protein